MLIGVPSEIKPQEKRVGLVPSSIQELVMRGHDAVVQSGAGLGIGATDADYEGVGASIASDAKSIFDAADMIVKVKEPQPAEWAMLSPNQILFTYLHLAADEAQARGLMESGCAAIAYETVTDASGGLPLLAPMSEVAGRLSVIESASHMKAPNGGQGLLISGVPGTPASHVVIIGGGVVGINAAKMAIGMGARVSILDRSVPRLRYLSDIFGASAEVIYSTAGALADAVLSADMVVGAVLVPGASAPRLISREMLSSMKPGSVLVDVAIDQGGCFETSRPTTHAEPTYEVDGVVHYCVANMPGAVPRTSALALNNSTLPYVIALADKGLAALDADPHLAAGLNVKDGKLSHPAVIDALGDLQAS